MSRMSYDMDVVVGVTIMSVWQCRAIYGGFMGGYGTIVAGMTKIRNK